MKLWILQPNAPWRREYDVLNAVIVRAETEIAARNFAQDVRGDENWESSNIWGLTDVWLNPVCTSCIELTADGEAGVILENRTNG